MRNTLYAVIAACCAMFATSGLVALATAAPPPAPQVETVDAERELVALLDARIEAQLAQLKAKLGLTL